MKGRNSYQIVHLIIYGDYGLIVRVGVNTDTEGGLKNETVDHKHTAGGADCLSIK